MIRLHPFENVYFNFLAGENLSAVQKRFELDYWGLSSRSALEYVVANDHSDTIKIFLTTYVQILNLQMLSPAQAKRIVVVDDEKAADYAVYGYCNRIEAYDFPNKFFEKKIEQAALVSVFKLK